MVATNRNLPQRHLEANRRAPAYSRALRRFRGVVQRDLLSHISATVTRDLPTNRFSDD